MQLAVEVTLNIVWEHKNGRPEKEDRIYMYHQ